MMIFPAVIRVSPAQNATRVADKFFDSYGEELKSVGTNGSN